MRNGAREGNLERESGYSRSPTAVQGRLSSPSSRQDPVVAPQLVPAEHQISDADMPKSERSAEGVRCLIGDARPGVDLAPASIRPSPSDELSEGRPGDAPALVCGQDAPSGLARASRVALVMPEAHRTDRLTVRLEPDGEVPRVARSIRCRRSAWTCGTADGSSGPPRCSIMAGSVSRAAVSHSSSGRSGTSSTAGVSEAGLGTFVRVAVRPRVTPRRSEAWRPPGCAYGDQLCWAEFVRATSELAELLNIARARSSISAGDRSSMRVATSQ